MNNPKFIVKCDKHGIYNNGNKTYEVGMAAPRTRRERVAGCQMCKKGLPARNEGK